MKSDNVLLDPNALDPTYDFVFHDFERSKIQQIRDLLAKDRGGLSLIYLAVVVFWTAFMSYGALIHGNATFALNHSPHVAFYTLILGVMLYPTRRMWVPIAAFCGVYFVPLFLPNAEGQYWADLTRTHGALVFAAFVYHIISGVLIAIVCMQVGQRLHRFSGPHTVDLLTVMTLIIVFLVFCLAQIWVFWQMSRGLSDLDQVKLGFDENYWPAAIERILRGGVVAAGFLGAILEATNRAVMVRGFILSGAFLILAFAQDMGFGFYPTLDVVLLALLLTSIGPVSSGIMACIIGVPFYSALTGTFVSTTHFGDPMAQMMEHAAILFLFIIVLIPTLRAHEQHKLHLHAASMRRLSMVRDFADVGLLSFNLDRQIFRTDSSAQRLLTCPPLGKIADFIALFDPKDQAQLRASLSDSAHTNVNLLLPRPAGQDGKTHMLRVCLWAEVAPSGEDVAYGVVLDVTGEHEQERILHETLLESSQQQERQRQLFSIISHELRTPASVIAMLVEDLDDGPPPIPARKQLREATDQLLSTLADMRQTVNPTQNLPITRVPYSPADLADSLRNMFEPLAVKHGMTIHLKLTDTSRKMRLGDQTRMRQALSNVVRNAIVHSKAKVITLAFAEVAQKDHLVSRWTITDNGVGIPSDSVDRMFQPFERGTQDPRSYVDGSGLGLYIVKSSVEILGGRISHFTPKGGGAGYVIEVPEPLANVTRIAPKSAPNPKADAKFADFFVLLAEDNALVAEVTLAKLQRFVGRVEVVGNGQDAYDRVLRDAPDLLITDLFMPDLDGDELTRRLRQQGHDLAIIGLTAAAVGDDIDRLKLAGASAVMIKPLDIAAVRDLIGQIAARKGAPPPAAKQRRGA